MVNKTQEEQNEHSLFCKKILSAVFYAVASFMITVINKTVLTTYGFPSYEVLGLGQMASTIIVLFIAKKLRIVSYPSFELNTVNKIFPLPIIYICNMIFGLGGTKQLSLPMFTALRRFSILMTMILELYILGVRPSTRALDEFIVNQYLEFKSTSMYFLFTKE